MSRKRALKSSTSRVCSAATNSFVKRSAVVERTRSPPPCALDVVADRVQQVGLAEAGRAVEEERVVGLAGQLGDGERGGVGEAVGVADDELVERELRVELGLGARRRRAPARASARGAARSARRARRRRRSCPGPSTAAAQVCRTRAKRSATQLRISSGAATTSVPSTTARGASGASQSS